MSSEDKTQLKVYVTRRTIDNFKRFLSQKWQTYGRGLISIEVEQAMRHYISEERGEHTHSSGASEEANNFHTMKGRKPKLSYTKEELDKIRHAIKVADAYIDKKIKGLKIEANEKEKVKAAMLKEEIVEWLVESGKFENRESIKLIPISLLRQAIGAIKKITDKRSINNQVEYLKTYKQIEQTGLGGKQYRFAR
jgi:hypothetical protein